MSSDHRGEVGVRVRVRGVVQGVGFRPFVHRLATERSLRGSVGNDGQGVDIVLRGTRAAIDSFLTALRPSAPPLATIDSVEVTSLAARVVVTDRFEILVSTGTTGDLRVAVPADVRTCDACLIELWDPANRRHRHPFITCTDCGPRFSIITAVPYERANTTMAEFAMCAECAAEYRNPSDRRFHAEPIACPDCGPRLRFRAAGNPEVVGDEAALAAAVRLLRSGGIVAVKGLGGYLLATPALDGPAVSRLRQRKYRDAKPFAVQVATVTDAERLVELDDTGRAMLTGPEAPIVLARRRAESSAVHDAVAPNNDLLGVMLPSTPLHHLLARAVGGALVLTSGNRSDEPIAYRDGDAAERLADIADGFLSHDRPIHRRTDDSVVRCGAGTAVLVRRARGFVPRAIPLDDHLDGPVVLAVGGELKSTICVTRGGRAYLSTHLGDLEHVSAFLTFRESIVDLTAFLGVEPDLIVHDLHPEYLSSKWAQGTNTALLGVQHHHAHIASCLAEHGIDGPVVGIAFDGHGYGPDAKLWGGEILVADRRGYERVAHLAEVELPGGTTAIRQGWRMAVAHLQRAYEGSVPPSLAVVGRHADRWDDVVRVASSPSTIRTTSVGRLFDAASAVLGIRDESSYEGQAAIELEQAARRAVPARISSARCLEPLQRSADHAGNEVLDPAGLMRSLCERVTATPNCIEELAYAFHVEVADAAARTAISMCERYGLRTVALSGGVFQNALLADLVRRALEATGLSVLTHRLVPANDAGLSLGQAAVGLAHLAGVR